MVEKMQVVTAEKCWQRYWAVRLFNKTFVCTDSQFSPSGGDKVWEESHYSQILNHIKYINLEIIPILLGTFSLKIAGSDQKGVSSVERDPSNIVLLKLFLSLLKNVFHADSYYLFCLMLVFQLVCKKRNVMFE